LKQISPALKSWAEFVEKALLIITLVIGLGMSAYKGIQFLSAKKSQVIAETQEVEKRIGILDALTETYLAQLKIINEDIRKLDEEMKEVVWKDSIKACGVRLDY
jgi:hypothetical protein